MFVVVKKYKYSLGTQYKQQMGKMEIVYINDIIINIERCHI